MTRPGLAAITFDLDNTLWDNHGVMARTEAGHYRWLDDALAAWLAGRDALPSERFAERFPLPAYQARRGELAERHPLRRGDFTWLRERALGALLEAYGLSPDMARHWAGEAMQRFLELRHEVEPYAEVEDLLETLGRRYRLASITNGNVDIRRLPLARHFPVSVAAGELLAPKPEPRPFLMALARLRCPPARSLHVGDSWEEDALPARRLGMQVAWIGDADSRLPPGIHRLAHVRELPDLLAWLERH